MPNGLHGRPAAAVVVAGSQDAGSVAAMLETLFRLRESGTTVRTEVVAGADLGTSTVTSYIESATGVEQGVRTGLTAVVVALLFLVALFFSPVVAMLGGYAPITTPALVVVGGMMLVNVRHLAWDDYTEVVPGFLVLLGYFVLVRSRL